MCACVTAYYTCCYNNLPNYLSLLSDDSQTPEAETMETGDQPADTSVIEGDRYVVILRMVFDILLCN